MPQHDDEELREAFSLFDKNNANRIPSKDLPSVLRMLGANPSPDELRAITQQYDSSGNGTIGFGDFKSILDRVSQDDYSDPERVSMAFRLFDRDGKGYLTVEEMKSVFAHLGDVKLSQEEINELIQEGRPDGSGRIDYQTLAQTLCQQ
eukprot:gb/GECH01011582.1/.p1 GENE.gb/GECH01011582.1/~~gb/GECH01011582.1/.p1  ORF type:complete len:148 (+),score=35.84 gb/GECH01011582.1/:1-444(+)